MLRRLSLLVSLLASLGVFASPAHAAKGMEIGIQDDSVFLTQYYGPGVVDYAYANSERFHATRQRITVQWVQTLVRSQRGPRKTPKKIRYDWSTFDAAIRAAQARGFHVQLVLSGAAPAWANGHHRLESPRSKAPNTTYKPNATLYGRWVGSAVRHFRTLGVQRYALWNEPNHTDTLRPLNQAATIYRKLWSRGNAAARKAYPKAQILFGELAPYGRRGISTSAMGFLRSVLCVNHSYTKRNRRCGKVVADGFGMHPYDNFRRKRGRDDVTINSLGNLTGKLDRLARLGALRKRGGGKLPVYLDEFGYLSRLQKSQRGKGAVTEKTRPAALRQAYSTALKNPRVKQLLWYGLVEPQRKSTANWYAYLFLRDGHFTNTYRAFVGWANQNRKRLAR